MRAEEYDYEFDNHRKQSEGTTVDSPAVQKAKAKSEVEAALAPKSVDDFLLKDEFEEVPKERIDSAGNGVLQRDVAAALISRTPQPTQEEGVCLDDAFTARNKPGDLVGLGSPGGSPEAEAPWRILQFLENGQSPTILVAASQLEFAEHDDKEVADTLSDEEFAEASHSLSNSQSPHVATFLSSLLSQSSSDLVEDNSAIEIQAPIPSIAAEKVSSATDTMVVRVT